MELLAALFGARTTCGTVGSGSVVQNGRRAYLDLIAKGRRERARFLTIVSGMEKYVRTGSEGGAAQPASAESQEF